MKIRVKRVSSLTKNEVEQLKPLTLAAEGKGSAMEWVVKNYSTKHRYYSILHEKNKKIRGWASLSRGVYCGASCIDLNVYVAKRHRRKGIGTRLVCKAKEVAKLHWPRIKILITPHDHKSKCFYRKLDKPKLVITL